MNDLLILASNHPVVFGTIVLLFSLLIGSFLNVVILRLPVMLERDWRRQAIEALDGKAPPPPDDGYPETFNLVTPRSRCPGCGQLIRSWENVPVLSWLLLRGRCGRCGNAISWRYPAVELLTGVLSLLIALLHGPTGTTLWLLGFVWILIALTFIDLDTMLLPDGLTWPLLAAGLLFNLDGGFVPLRDAVLGGLIGYTSLWTLFHAFKAIDGREGLGYGDFVLLGAFGAWFGWQALPVIALLAAGVGAAATGLSILLGRQDGSQPVPFGPYLTGAGFLVLIFRDPLVALTLGSSIAT